MFDSAQSQPPIHTPAPDAATTSAPGDLPFLNPLTIGEMLDRSFRLYRKHFRAFLQTSAIFMLPYAVLSALLLRTALQDQFAMLSVLFGSDFDIDTLNALAAQSNAAQAGLATVLIPLLGLLVTMIVTLGLTLLAVRTLRGETPSLRMALQGIRQRFWAWFRLDLLRYLAFLGLLIVVTLLVAIAASLSAVLFGGAISLLPNNFGTGDGFLGVAVVIVGVCCLWLGLSLLIIGPFAWVYARWSVANPALIDQNLHAREALRTSWRLTRGSVLRIVLYLLLVWILYAIVVGIPVYLLQGISLIAFGSNSIVLVSVLSTLVGTLFTIFWQPLAAIFFVLLYFDMLVRSSGSDILERLERLEAGLQDAATNARDTEATLS